MDCSAFPKELINAIGVDDFVSKRDFGRDRGLSPVPTEHQMREIDKLNQKLSTKLIQNKITKKGKEAVPTPEEEQEEALAFDLKSRLRVKSFEGSLTKRSVSSMFPHNSRRYGYLLNDVLLITSHPSNPSAATRLTNLVSLNGPTDKINIHQIFYLDNIAICDLIAVDDNEDPCSFQVSTPEKYYIFVAETETDKRIWLEELQISIYAIHSQKLNQTLKQQYLKLGWFHHVIRHTLSSAAYYGNIPLIQHFITKTNQGGEGDGEELLRILNTPDDSGMIPLHWAILNGHYEAVKLLLQVGSNPDLTNGGMNNALLLACAMGNAKIIFTLLDYGVIDVQSTNMHDYHALLMLLFFAPTMHCVFFTSPYATQPLGNNTQYIGAGNPFAALESASSPGNNGNGNSFRFASTASTFDLAELIQALQMHGVDINLFNVQGNTPLHLLAHQHPALQLSPDPMSGAGGGIMEDEDGNEVSKISLAPSILALVDSGVDVNLKSQRSGYTPLQLACYVAGNIVTTEGGVAGVAGGNTNAMATTSLLQKASGIDDIDDVITSSTGMKLRYYPDVEIIRALLDKGALMNWKDHAKRTAFDLLILSTTNQRHTQGDPNSINVTRRVDDNVADFVQFILPSLMELVRKGVRYTPSSIAHLRDSFQEALQSGVDHWKKMTEPSNFQQYVAHKGEVYFTSKNWTADSASQFCLFCLDKFTYQNRRHHCRICGVLCCDLCSSKRLCVTVLPEGVSATTPEQVSGGAGSGGGKKSPKIVKERVCDACFNRVVFESDTYHMSLQSKRRQEQQQQLLLQQQQQQQQQLLQQSPSTPTSLSNPFRSLTGGASGSGSGKQSVGNTSSGGNMNLMAQTQGVMNEAMRALEDRGKRIEDVAVKSEQMVNAASDFRQMTKELLRQQQEKNAQLSLLNKKKPGDK